MNFLKHAPIVFVVGENYEIVIVSKTNGLCWIEVAGEAYYEENSGVFHTEKNRVKITVPQKKLDKVEQYTICFRESIARKSYYSELGETERFNVVFFSLKKQEGIGIYHLADIHNRFDLAKKCIELWKDQIDLIIINGDTAEVETEKNYWDTYAFLAEISQGSIPILFIRGNHDVRGHCAEYFEEFFPCFNKKFYYTFTLGILSGIVFDCGEDKPDDRIEYGGVNCFEKYRQKETLFLKSISASNREIPPFAVGHICPIKTTFTKGDIFDIERNTYTEWSKEFERIGISYMLCGHLHKAFILNSDSEQNIIQHSYPVIIGSAVEEENLWGAMLIMGKETMQVYFSNSNGQIGEQYHLKYKEKILRKVDFKR